jgi:hypothetical protein
VKELGRKERREEGRGKERREKKTQ